MFKITAATEPLLAGEVSDFCTITHYIISGGAYAGLYTSVAITLFRHRLIIDIRTHANERNHRSTEAAADADRAAYRH